jgi:GTP:adenosylcobinamide-phosphate guanylyltransferase
MTQNSIYGRRLLGYVVESGTTVNIDTLDDWKLAEELLAATGSEGSP